jgi:glycosyltransferase involved in cell wall biosynthesis
MSKFSIIVPVKKGKLFLQKAVTSILSQTYTDFDVIILADSTTNSDGSIDWLNSLQLQNLVVIQAEQDLNIQENWSRILSVRKGEYFTILGYDDLLYENYLQVMNDLIQAYPEATLYQTQFDFIDNADRVTSESEYVGEVFNGAGFLTAVLQSQFYIMATGYMIRSSDYAQVGGISVAYPNLLFADYELWLRLTFLGKLVISPQKCFAFRIHQSTTNISSERFMLKSFSLLVDYLLSLKEQKRYAQIIEQWASYFLRYNCNYMVYRLIRKERKFRKGLRVADVLKEFSGFAEKLGVNDLQLIRIRSIRLAWYIDKHILLSNAYILLKKLIKKPLLKPDLD